MWQPETGGMAHRYCAFAPPVEGCRFAESKPNSQRVHILGRGPTVATSLYNSARHTASGSTPKIPPHASDKLKHTSIDA